MADEQLAAVTAALEKILVRVDRFTEEVQAIREELDTAGLAWANDQRDYRARVDDLLVRINERLDALERR